MGIFVLLFAVLITAGLIWLLLRKKNVPDLPGSSLDDVGPSGVILVKGDEYLVEQKNRYAGGGEESFELKLTGDEDVTFWLNWYQDGGLIVTITQEVDFDELELTSADLDMFDSQQIGEFDFDGVVYHLSASGESQLYENCQSNGEPFYYWDFGDEEHKHVINIQYWDRNTYEASIGGYIQESDIEIYSMTEDS